MPIRNKYMEVPNVMKSSIISLFRIEYKALLTSAISIVQDSLGSAIFVVIVFGLKAPLIHPFGFQTAFNNNLLFFNRCKSVVNYPFE